MKRMFTVAVIIIALSSMVFGQTKSTPPSSTRPGSAAANVTVAALKKLERQWFDAMAQQDMDALGRLMADDYLATNHQGIASNKADTLEQFKLTALRIEPQASGEKVRVLGTTAIITGQATVDGQREILYTQVWVNRLGRWRIASWQSTPVTHLAKMLLRGKVITTASGLRYIDLIEGSGAIPKKGQTTVVHYTGTLEDGRKFDSSLDRGQPFDFPIGMGRVIKGWDEGVITMKVGGKRILIIPSNLGYGAKGAGNVIPPNATLIFEVELLDVK